MTGVDEMHAFVRRCLDRDEQDALAQQEFDAWAESQRDPTHVDAIAVPPLSQLGSGGDPARVLAEVKAKRRILDEAVEAIVEFERNDVAGGWPNISKMQLARTVVEQLAQPYAGQPGWREEWRTDV